MVNSGNLKVSYPNVKKKMHKAKLIHYRVSFIYFQSIVSGKSKGEDI